MLSGKHTDGSSAHRCSIIVSSICPAVSDPSNTPPSSPQRRKGQCWYLISRSRIRLRLRIEVDLGIRPLSG